MRKNNYRNRVSFAVFRRASLDVAIVLVFHFEKYRPGL